MAIDAEQVMWGALGAGSKGVVAGVVGGTMPEAKIPADVVTGGIGFAMANWGGRRVGDVGMGLLLASIGQIIATPLEKFVGGIIPTNGNANKNTLKTNNNPTGNMVNSNSQDAYVLARYGVN